MFAWSERELNQEQSDAVYDENNILLISCPGSGKTRTLTYKIAYELSRLENEHKFIIAITYTNRAADEIKERVELLGVDTKNLWIGTIHSFCLEWILRPYSLYLDELNMGFKVIDSQESESLITEICTSYNSENRTRITYWDCQYIFVDETRFEITSQNSSQHVENVLQRYFKYLEDNYKVDYELILFYSYKLLKEYPIICKTLSNIFSYLLIDEYQDTRTIQYSIIGDIFKNRKSDIKLFVVGDPNQSIYQTLGGYPMDKSSLESLTDLYIKELELSKNYRSSKKIIEYFDYFKTFENKITPSGKHKDHSSIISLNTSVTRENLIDKISELIIHEVEELKISENEICVIAPWWFHLGTATRRLIANLPDYNFDGPGIAPFARDIDNFWYKISRIILTEPTPNLFVRRIRWSSEILDELQSLGASIGELGNRDFLRLCNAIDPDETEGLKYLETAFEAIFDELGLEVESFPSLWDQQISFFESSESRLNRLENDGIEGVNTVENFRKVFSQRNGITVSTLHGVKGAEFDTVIAFGLLQGFIPHFSDKKGDENSKKLLYVISSRAKKNLYLIAERGRIDRFNNRERDTTQHLVDYQYSYDSLS